MVVAAMLDMWDPNTWEVASHEFRIYGDDRADIFAVVDEVDYQWAIGWRWHPKPSKNGRKIYLFRTQSVYREGFARQNRSLFLHVEILRRFRPVRPTEQHTISDHRNGNSLDCRRGNLRWATPSMNRLNLHGQYPYDLADDAVCLLEDRNEQSCRDPQADAWAVSLRIG